MEHVISDRSFQNLKEVLPSNDKAKQTVLLLEKMGQPALCGLAYLHFVVETCKKNN